MTAHRKSLVMRAVERSGRLYGLDPDTWDPEFVRAQLPVWSTLFGPGRYFDCQIRGLERVPDAPVMLVSNHSGGTTTLDAVGFLVEWYRHRGVERPVHGLAHDLLFSSHTLGRYFERCGVLRARADLARDAQARGRSILVMPGGDLDVWRPARHRYRCDFGGRTGYARTALELGMTVVPVAHAGAHSTLHVLTDGRDFARLVRLHRVFRAEIWPVHLSIPWGLALGPLPHLPPPAHLDYAVGEPIPPLGPPTPENVARLDARVRAEIQRLLLDLRERRRRRDRDLARHARRAAETALSLRDLARELRRRAR